MSTEISEKQLQANRKNAKKGGVKSEAGKSISKYNAVKHGLLSQQVLLEGEDEESLIELGERLRKQIKPKGEVEEILTDRIIVNVWRLRRLLEVETATMEWQMEEILSNHWVFEKGEEHGMKKATREVLVNEDIEKIMRYEAMIERGIYKALHELQRIQSARLGNNPPAPIALDIDVTRKE